MLPPMNISRFKAPMRVEGEPGADFTHLGSIMCAEIIANTHLAPLVILLAKSFWELHAADLLG